MRSNGPAFDVGLFGDHATAINFALHWSRLRNRRYKVSHIPDPRTGRDWEVRMQ